jgi:hypothetical protein
MITDADIKAGKLPLGNDKILALLMLVKRLPPKERRPSNVYDLEARIVAVKGTGDPLNPTTPATPTMDEVKGMALDAVLTRLNALPNISVEDEGTDKERSFFSAAVNWKELAQDVLDVLYESNQQGQNQVFLVVQRTLRGYGLIGCGPDDELRATIRGGH